MSKPVFLWKGQHQPPTGQDVHQPELPRASSFPLLSEGRHLPHEAATILARGGAEFVSCQLRGPLLCKVLSSRGGQSPNGKAQLRGSLTMGPLRFLELSALPPKGFSGLVHEDRSALRSRRNCCCIPMRLFQTGAVAVEHRIGLPELQP